MVCVIDFLTCMRTTIAFVPLYPLYPVIQVLAEKYTFLEGMVFVCHNALSVPCSLVVICWERADFLALLYVMFSCVFCHFPIWYPGSGVVFDCIDS